MAEIPAGYAYIDEAAATLANLTSRPIKAAKVYLIMVVNTQHDPRAPVLRFVEPERGEFYLQTADVQRLRQAFEGWLPRVNRGRPKGSFKKSDMPLVMEGVKMLSQHEADSRLDAAKKLFAKYKPPGNSADSTIRRLERGIKRAMEALDKK